MTINLLNKFSFEHSSVPNETRTVTWNKKEECYLEDGGRWTRRQVEGFVSRDTPPMWINVRPVLPEGKFMFNHEGGDLYFGEVKGDKLHVTWNGTPSGVEGCEYALDGGLSSAYDHFLKGVWVLNDFANSFKVGGTPAENVHERLRSISRSMSYNDDASQSAGKFLLLELAEKLENGTAHAPAPLHPTLKLLELASEALHDVTFLSNGKIMLNPVSGGHCVTLVNVELALRWFGLKAQLDALEA